MCLRRSSTLVVRGRHAAHSCPAVLYEGSKIYLRGRATVRAAAADNNDDHLAAFPATAWVLGPTAAAMATFNCATAWPASVA